MIMEREILKGQQCPEKYKDNLLELLIKMNKVRDAYGRPMFVTSGFRTMKDHIRIYESMGIPRNKIPLQSKHLYCQACDIADPDNSLMEWVKKHVKLMEEIGLWMEEDDTVNRVHFQTVPPKSGRRFFNP